MVLPVEVLPQIMQAISFLREGKTLNRACYLAGVSRHSFVTHVSKNPELQQVFDDALAEADDTLAEILVDIDQEHSDAKMAAVVSKNIQWLLSRRRPERYGDKITVTTQSSADQEIVGALKLALQRIPVPAQPLLTQEAHVMIDVSPEAVTVEDLL
jgi:hypothetical protein